MLNRSVFLATAALIAMGSQAISAEWYKPSSAAPVIRQSDIDQFDIPAATERLVERLRRDNLAEARFQKRGLASARFVPLPPRRGDGGTVFVLVSRTAKRHGVPLRLAHAVTKVESGYRCNVTGGSARGAMQVNPATARSVGVYGNLHKCEVGIEAGMRYLAQAYRASGGNLCLAATAYNSGRIGTRSCSRYGHRVMRLAGA